MTKLAERLYLIYGGRGFYHPSVSRLFLSHLTTLRVTVWPFHTFLGWWAWQSFSNWWRNLFINLPFCKFRKKKFSFEFFILLMLSIPWIHIGFLTSKCGCFLVFPSTNLSISYFKFWEFLPGIKQWWSRDTSSGIYMTSFPKLQTWWILVNSYPSMLIDIP